MLRSRHFVAILLVALPGCSAVGAWLYQDPTYALRSVDVRRGAEQGSTDSLELTFVGCNLNDYDITETSFATTMSIGGKSAGPGDHGQTIYLATRDTSRFSVIVPMHAEALPEQGSRPFEVKAVSQVRTPIGDRAVNVRMAGLVERSGAQLNWKMKPQECKPGTSVLPASFDTRAIPPGARPGSAGTVNDGQPR
jgi:hypothetical protein